LDIDASVSAARRESAGSDSRPGVCRRSDGFRRV